MPTPLGKRHRDPAPRTGPTTRLAKRRLEHAREASAISRPPEKRVIVTRARSKARRVAAAPEPAAKKLVPDGRDKAGPSGASHQHAVKNSGPPRFRGPRVGKLWFDVLSPELTSRIAAYVTRGEGSMHPNFQINSALALAETKFPLKKAVQEALGYKLELPILDMCCSTGPKQQRWVDILDNVLHVDATNADFYAKAPLEALMRPTMRFVAIRNRPEYLRAVSKVTNLLDLMVCVESGSYTRFIALLQALKRLSNLASLRLCCSPRPWFGRYQCIFSTWLSSHESYADLAARCPKLVALHVSCRCREETDFSPIADTFQQLAHISLNRRVTDNALPFLRSRQSVTLESISDGFRFAPIIGNSVTGITYEQRSYIYEREGKTARASDLVALANCSRLARLHLDLKPRAERSFPQTLIGLKSLRLHWDPLPWVPGQQLRTFHTLDSGWLSSVVDRNPELHELEVTGASISSDELTRTLRMIGTRLRIFITSITNQPETPVERLISLLECMREYNTELRRFQVQEVYGSTRHILGEVGFDLDEEEESKSAKRVFRSMERLHQSAPFLNLESMSMALSWLFRSFERGTELSRWVPTGY